MATNGAKVGGTMALKFQNASGQYILLSVFFFRGEGGGGGRPERRRYGTAYSK
jgi:hypothetical protein